MRLFISAAHASARYALLPSRTRSFTAAARVDEKLSVTIIRDLESVLGAGAVSESMALREQMAKDESYRGAADGLFPPQAVVFPRTTEEVAEIVRVCLAHRTPIVPSGACTSLEGHLAALRGGVSVNFRDMAAVLAVNQEDMDCRVQAGCTRKALNEHLRDTGLFFPIDPGADASLGGMASTRASGTNAVRYGTMRENVLGLTAVMPDGSVVRTGGRARKSSTGYDLTRLLVGAEGTLGVITEVAVRLHGQPEAVSSAVCEFDSLEGAAQATMAIIQGGIPVARIELLDAPAVDAVNKYSQLALRVTPTLFFEFHGSPAAVEEQAAAAGEIATDFGAQAFQWASSPEERARRAPARGPRPAARGPPCGGAAGVLLAGCMDGAPMTARVVGRRLWAARHVAYYAAIALRPGCQGMPTDACVPISRLASVIAESDADLRASGLVGPLVGHVGDGNFHYCIALNPADKGEVAAVQAFGERLARRAIAAGGTCSGEHGVGYGKLKFLEEEHGAAAVAVMRSIKAALDPHNIMNPAKLGSI